MAKKKVVNPNQNSDLIGGNFTNVASQTVFQFGDFSLQTNVEPRTVRDYSNVISSFAKPISLESLNLSDAASRDIFNITQKVQLNPDKSDLTSFARYGSLKELLRVSIENIILAFPASLHVDNNLSANTTFVTVLDFSYDIPNNVSEFEIPTVAIENKFGLVFDSGNTQLPDGITLKNINVSFGDYVIWKEDDSTNNTHTILGFSGDTPTNSFVRVKVKGNPFPEIGVNTTLISKYHIKPNPLEFNKFKKNITPLESFLIDKTTDKGFKTTLKNPIEMENGEMVYADTDVLWSTSDGYNVDTDNSQFLQYLTNVKVLGENYDLIKTDLIYRFLTPESLKEFDVTDDKKLEKLLRIYGREFDEIRQYIDAIATINKVSYDKKQNMPDILVKNFAGVMGWKTFDLIKSDDDLLDNFFSTEQIQNDGILPAEVDIELWRRILINTQYFFKRKGTRSSFKSMLLLLGIPEPFINITEYVYTVEGKINPNEVTIELEDFPSSTLPYDTQGYPLAPVETNDFYFQLNGDTDFGQAYLDVFRQAGFKLSRIVDNKKSWVETGETVRVHTSTPRYDQVESKLIINTKELDASLDTARAIEFDVFAYNQEENFPVTSTGVTNPFVYINIPFEYTVSADTFTLTEDPQGDIQVNFNGITLTKGTGPGNKDYYTPGGSPRDVILNDGVAQDYGNGEMDVITLTYLNDQLDGVNGDLSSITFVIARITPDVNGTKIPLPEVPLGDVQLTVDGITLSKGTSLYTGDFAINPQNSQEIILRTDALKDHILKNQVVTISYISPSANINVFKRSEIHRIDSLVHPKLFFNTFTTTFTYVMDFEAVDGKSVKFIVNGITLQNGKDFTLNPQNKTQLFIIGPNLQLGDIINVFYVLANEDSVVDLGGSDSNTDVSDLSFLEYIKLLCTKLINVQNRKIITDHNTGFYPTLYKVYEDYMKRSALASTNPAKSNGYTFNNLFGFSQNFDNFFTRFLTQLVPSTVILRQRGSLIRNTVFNKQKFTYKRGLNFDPNVNWFGTDGSEFKLKIPVDDNLFAWSGATCVVEEFGCGSFIMSDVIVINATGDSGTCTMVLDSVEVLDTSASNVNDGQITVNVTGTLGATTYILNGGSAQSENVFPNLGIGSHTVDVFDAGVAGCTISVTNINIISTGVTPTVVPEHTISAFNDSFDVVADQTQIRCDSQFSILIAPALPAGTVVRLEFDMVVSSQAVGVTPDGNSDARIIKNGIQEHSVSRNAGNIPDIITTTRTVDVITGDDIKLTTSSQDSLETCCRSISSGRIELVNAGVVSGSNITLTLDPNGVIAECKG